ncbi:glycosyltransferase family 4 protein [Azospirillum sp. RWY-5-1]|uniref:Glycosyltransferase family 4 protein n=1 Tax=Azospirillum oleiclasticum TaxID=2735135 RepID=A0ABX2TB67_9PROT|nr:glycosyltransferase family 4 protein [Azospirillum oleiclasticum]NYZ13058.1 glycosyltransferase family 4 protein [Azospirillum oleiclasticum]NYZ20269.1 glycosyltransferase family 4 protein [Azospirillum oleiclasticum]
MDEALRFVVPGPITQTTGGYIYDRRVVEGMRAAGHAVDVVELPGVHPRVDDATRRAAAATLAAVPDGAPVVVDGLALPALADAVTRDAGRLRLSAMIHHPLWLETGLAAGEAERLRALEAGCLSAMRRIVVPSARTLADVVAMGVPAERVTVVPPGTDPAPFAAGSGDGMVRLLSVATLTPRKGHATLIEALRRLESAAWRLLVVGSAERDPEHAARLRAIIAAAGLGERVTLAGELDGEALAAAFHGADLFVQASHHEGFGMALAEALAHGLPVVATAVGAAPELVPAGAGLLVPPGDAAALAAALGRVIADAGERRRLAAGARRAAAALPGWDETARRFAAGLRLEL